MGSISISTVEMKQKIEQEIDEVEAAIRMFQEKAKRGVYLSEDKTL